MDNKDIKKRDVMSFEKFAKAYELAKTVVPQKGAETVTQMGTHKIEAEGLWARHDANVYIAAGIPLPKDANASDRVIPGHSTPPQEKPHDGQDPLPGAKLVKGQDVQDPLKDLKDQTKAAATYAASSEDSSEIIKKKAQ